MSPACSLCPAAPAGWRSAPARHTHPLPLLSLCQQPLRRLPAVLHCRWRCRWRWHWHWRLLAGSGEGVLAAPRRLLLRARPATHAGRPPAGALRGCPPARPLRAGTQAAHRAGREHAEGRAQLGGGGISEASWRTRAPANAVSHAPMPAVVPLNTASLSMLPMLPLAPAPALLLLALLTYRSCRSASGATTTRPCSSVSPGGSRASPPLLALLAPVSCDRTAGSPSCCSACRPRLPACSTDAARDMGGACRRRCKARGMCRPRSAANVHAPSATRPPPPAACCAADGAGRLSCSSTRQPQPCASAADSASPTGPPPTHTTRMPVPCCAAAGAELLLALVGVLVGLLAGVLRSLAMLLLRAASKAVPPPLMHDMRIAFRARATLPAWRGALQLPHALLCCVTGNWRGAPRLRHPAAARGCWSSMVGGGARGSCDARLRQTRNEREAKTARTVWTAPVCRHQWRDTGTHTAWSTSVML
jgi:hypothetical protein